MKYIKKLTEITESINISLSNSTSTRKTGGKTQAQLDAEKKKKEEEAKKKAEAAALQKGVEFERLAAQLDGFALYFSAKVESLVQYDEASMGQCKGVLFDDDEGCFWKVIWRNWEAEAVPTAYVKFKEALDKLQNMVWAKTAPNMDMANQVLYRAKHNYAEATRMNQKDHNWVNTTEGSKYTLRGMVMKQINTDDHNFRWTMYYTNTSVIPYGGGQPAQVRNTESKSIDCDF